MSDGTLANSDDPISKSGGGFNADFWPTRAVTRGVHRLGLCSTRTRTNNIRWKAERPTTNCKQPQVDSDQS